MLEILAAALIFTATGNTPPETPTILEPTFEGDIVNPEDAHMETGPFADPDPGDTHTATDWEIWTISPPQRIWAALGATGPEMVHIHLGDGVFEGSHAGRVSLVPSTAYTLRVRHRDSSGIPASQWSDYAMRGFSTGELTSVFPLELDDIVDPPTPVWLDGTAMPVLIPGGALHASLHVESADAEAVLIIAGGQGQNQIVNPAPIAEHVPVRVRLDAGGQPLFLPETDLAFTDDTGTDRTVLLPSIGLQPGEEAYFWVSANGSTYFGTAAQEEPDFSTLARGVAVPWAVSEPGYKVEIVASGFQLPVNIAFVPNPGPQPDAPMFYITELYGSIRVVRRDGTVGTYASNLINFNPTGAFPGSGEQGVAGIVVDATTGDVFASMLYEITPGGAHYPKVVRFHSNDGGHTAATQTTILDMVGESQGQSHQISSLSIGPDGKLYIHMGDGFSAATAQNLSSYRGKVLRANLDGSAPPDNPFYNAGNGITAADFVFAYGVRNPFGGAWRAADSALYEVENGPSVDRFARIDKGKNYLWDGSDASMANFAIYNWAPATGPVNIAFIQAQTHGGSGFPPSKLGHAFVTESGPTWGTGPQANGKRITEFVLDGSGNLVSGPTPFAFYNGSGKATAVGLAAGPDGLYFSDLYKDQGYASPIDAGANILRIRFIGAADFSADVTSGPAPLVVRFTDMSSVPSPMEWSWTFGDGATSTAQDPEHTYAQEGIYNVRLSVTGPGGVAVVQKNAFVKVGQTPSIAMIGGSIPPSSADAAIAAALEAKGFTVDAFDDEPAGRPSAHQLEEDYDLAIVSSSVASGNIAGEFRDAHIPLVFWEQALLRSDREGLASGGNVVSGASSINVLTSTHPITAGLPIGNAPVFQPAASMSIGTGTIAPGALVVARRASSTDAAILVAEEGVTLLNGYIAPARRAFLFFEDSSYLSATPGARTILERALCWAGELDPAVVEDPAPLAAYAGSPAAFMVKASGGGPMSFQWRRDGVNLANDPRISGATSSMLKINPVLATDAGEYDCIITNPCGSVPSEPALLEVLCYADCEDDGDLDVFDYLCFLDAFSQQAAYADCEGDGDWDVFDFLCFQGAFADGCP